MAFHLCFGHVTCAYVQTSYKMASGLVRSAISRIHQRPECQVKSKRVASVIKDADDLLKVISEPINLDHFDTFSRDLVAKLESCFQGEFVNRERVWKAFHKIRTHDLTCSWEKRLSGMHFRTSVDPLVPQTACQILFEDTIKMKFKEQRSKAREEALSSSSVLTKDEHILVFVDGPGDSFMDYTREWISKVNRGGLFETSDNAYMLFASIELASYKKLEERLV